MCVGVRIYKWRHALFGNVIYERQKIKKKRAVVHVTRKHQSLHFVRRLFHHFEPRQLPVLGIILTVAHGPIVSYVELFDFFDYLTSEIFASVVTC